MKTELFDMVDMDYLFTVITADRAVEYTGKEVYVADSIKGLENAIKAGTTRTLEGINNIICELRFNVHNDDCTTSAYALCVPADKVHKIEKQLRPFTTIGAMEFATNLHLGDTITVRGKDWEEGDVAELMYLGNGVRDGIHTVNLGNMCMRVEDWFEYEYLDEEKDEWIPFGEAIVTQE